MSKLSHASSRRMYSWWWDSHISPQNSRWLIENLTGSYLDTNLHGGPGRWGEGVQFIEVVEIISDENTSLRNGAAAAHQLSTSHASSYRISCNKIGAYRIVFKRGNLIGDDHPLPAVAEVQLTLRCSFPPTMVLIVDESGEPTVT